MSAESQHLTVWRQEFPPKTVVTMRLEFTDSEIAEVDLSALDRALLAIADRPDATSADRLLALECFVRARERKPDVDPASNRRRAS